MGEFRRASNELKATLDREVQNLERENEGLQSSTDMAPDSYRYGYEYKYDPPSSSAITPYRPPTDTTLTPSADHVPSVPGTAPEGTVSTSAAGIVAPLPAEPPAAGLPANGKPAEPAETAAPREPRT